MESRLVISPAKAPVAPIVPKGAPTYFKAPLTLGPGVRACTTLLVLSLSPRLGQPCCLCGVPDGCLDAAGFAGVAGVAGVAGFADAGVAAAGDFTFVVFDKLETQSPIR